MSKYENIIQIKECNLGTANLLLEIGWKILKIKPEPVYITQTGIIHNKHVQTGIKIVYVLGCPKGLKPMKQGNDWIQDYYRVMKREKK